jgi:hypothetical protein
MSNYTTPRMSSPWPVERFAPRARRRHRRVTAALALVATARQRTAVPPSADQSP